MTADEVMTLIRASKNLFYCYVLYRPSGLPFYVGVGRVDRLLDHVRLTKTQRRTRKLGIIRKIEANGGSVRYAIAAWCGSWNDAADHERRLIRIIGRHDLGLGPLANMTDGGDGKPGHRATPKTCAKISAAHRGKTVSAEVRAALRKINLGRRHTAEVREKMTDAHKGHPVSDTTRQKIAAAKTGQAHTREARAKISAARALQPRRPCSPETRDKIALSSIGRKCSIEARANISTAQRARFERHRSEGGLKLPHHKNSTPEGRAKFQRPVEIKGIVYVGTDVAAETLAVSKSTIKRWLASGQHSARRL